MAAYTDVAKVGEWAPPTIERKVRWVLTGDPPPEYWRAGASWFLTDGTRDTLYTNALGHQSPFNHDHVMVNYRPVWQTREVSEWKDET